MRRLKRPEMWVVFAVGIILAGRDCTGFNLDTSQAITRAGPAGSLFGYTVALHRDSGGVNILLVGAPHAETPQPGVERGGAVYRCPVSEEDCEQIQFDTSGQPLNDNVEQVGSKSNQFFGSTLHSSGPGGPVVACAPRRVWSMNLYNTSNSKRFLTGACFLARNDFVDIQEVSPCEKPDEEESNPLSESTVGYCQAGFSASITQDMKLFLGAPGSFYWQGQLISIDFNNHTKNIESLERNFRFDNFYLGYSVARGRFGSEGFYVVSQPRANSFRGLVSIANEELTFVHEIQGEQMSAYFGFSLVVTDTNADGLDDLIIGAPMFVDPDHLIDRWEVGRIYLYCQGVSGALVKTDVLTGTHAGGQFGYSIAALGDVNRDGFNDIAVSAPFAGEGRSGIVYIYQGRRKGIKETPAQVLRPADFGLNLKSFGTSLSGGLDMDGNNYNDILIGAFKSSASVLVRARPIVRIQKSLTFEPEQINLDIKDYQLPLGQKVSSFNVTTCLTARGHDTPTTIDVKYSVQLDATLPTTSRAAFVLDNNLDVSEMTRTIRLTIDEESCQKDLAYVKLVILEKNLPIGVRLVYELSPGGTGATAGPPSVSTPVLPILNETPQPVLLQSLLIANTCQTYLCDPDLRLIATTNTEKVAIGGDWELRIDVTVSNYGEDAYEASFYATIPEGMTFVRVERRSTDISVTCSSDEDSGVLTCDIGNPLPEEYTVDFGIIIVNDRLSVDQDELLISMRVDSLNFESKNLTSDNYANVTVGVYATASLNLFGISTPQQTLYLQSNGNFTPPEPKTEQEAGPEVTHSFMLRNLGPSEVGHTRVEILWPLADADGDYVLYLISAKLGSGEDCHVEGGVNPGNLELDEVEDNANVSNPLGQLTFDPKSRKRRESGNGSQSAIPQTSTGVTIECDGQSAQCVLVTCNISNPSIEAEDVDSALIQIKSRLYEKTLMKKNYVSVFISSTANATVQSMPYIESLLPDAFPTTTAQATTQVIGQAPETPLRPPTQVTIIPIWVYIVAAIGGSMILLIVILGLWKCGFFKRKKIVPNDPQSAAQDNWEGEVLLDEKK